MTQEVIKYNVTDAAIAKMQKEYLPLVVKGVDDKEGYEAVKKAHTEVKEIRIGVEKRRKELKADALEYGRRVDSEANRISAELEKVENHLKEQRDIVDKEEKRRKEQAERERQEEINLRIQRMQLVNAKFDLSEIALMSKEAFEAKLGAARQEFLIAEQKRMMEEEELNKLREQQAEETKKREAAEAENRRLRDELEERQRREIAEKEAQLQKEREEREENDRRHREELWEQQRKADEERAQREREDRERREKAEAEERAAKEKREREEREAAEKIADKKLFDQIKKDFPTVELAWVEIARLRKAAAKK